MAKTNFLKRLSNNFRSKRMLRIQKKVSPDSLRKATTRWSGKNNLLVGFKVGNKRFTNMRSAEKFLFSQDKYDTIFPLYLGSK